MPNEVVGRARLGFVVFLCVVASAVLPGCFLTAFPSFHGMLGGGPFYVGFGRPTIEELPTATGAGAAAALCATLLLRRAGLTVWPWLLAAGGLLGLTQAVPYLVAADESTDIYVRWWFVAGAGAASVLVVLGLFAAAHWLTHAGGVRAAAPVIGAAVVAPLAGLPVFAAFAVPDRDLRPEFVVMAVLAAVGAAAALGTLALLPAVRRAPRPAPPSTRTAVVGVLAGLLPVATELALKINWNPIEIMLEADPESPVPVVIDAWVLRLGFTGVLVFAAAVVLARLLGPRVLGPLLGAALLTYGVLAPAAEYAWTSSPGRALLLFLAGFAVGVAAAMTPWRTWFAVGSATLLAVATITPALSGTAVGPALVAGATPAELPSEALIAVTLVLVGITAVTGVTTAAAVLREHTSLPVALGLVAVAAQSGLYYTAALAQHSSVALPDPLESVGILHTAAAITLLVGGLLVMVAAASPRRETPQPDALAATHPG